jgi:LmbE family N-acetylglucosaminyl deacetylase
MCITAHPDDECGAFGGALMLAKARGVETSVLCLTEGKAASNRGDARNEDELALLRREEFAAALRILEVTHGEVLDYPDGKLLEQNFLEVVSKLVERIRSFRPQVVLTFGGDGAVNLHPDHTMVSLFTTAAFHWAGRVNFLTETASKGLLPYHPQKLYYLSPSFLFQASTEEARKVALVPPSLVIEVGELTVRKFHAFQQHRSQAAILARVRDTFEEQFGFERYLLAASRGMRQSPMERDMFEDVEDEPSPSAYQSHF